MGNVAADSADFGEVLFSVRTVETQPRISYARFFTVTTADGDTEFAWSCLNPGYEATFDRFYASLDTDQTQREVLLSLGTPELAELLHDFLFPLSTEWDDLDPATRVLDMDTTPREVFEDLWPVVFDMDVPTWWNDGTHEYALCPRIERAWTGFCLGPQFVGDSEIRLEAWVASDGLIEMHLTTGQTSTALLGQFNIADSLNSPHQLVFDPSIAGVPDLINRAAKGEEVLISTDIDE